MISIKHLIKSGAYSTDEKKTYYRMHKSVNASDDEQVTKVISMFGEAVLKGLAVRVSLDPPPEEDTSVYALVEKLRELPQCHFV